MTCFSCNPHNRYGRCCHSDEDPSTIVRSHAELLQKSFRTGARNTDERESDSLRQPDSTSRTNRLFAFFVQMNFYQRCLFNCSLLQVLVLKLPDVLLLAQYADYSKTKADTVRQVISFEEAAVIA